MNLGKIYTQNLHHWFHWSTDSKGVYNKDWISYWVFFYKALHTSLANNEKIVTWIRYAGGDSGQI